MNIPKKKLGKTGISVTILGLGGNRLLATPNHQNDAYKLINVAIDQGINYFDTARLYSNSESYYGNALKERRKEVFLASKSHSRNKKVAIKHLHQTLNDLKTDYIDFWQIHDVRTKQEVEEIFSTNGAIEAFVEAKNKGKVKFLGVTGHRDPSIIKCCIDNFDFDTVLIPVNPAEPTYKNFIDEIIPAAIEKNMGIIGMYVYLGGRANSIHKFDTMEPFLRFALSQPIAIALIGCDNILQLDQNVHYASEFKSMTKDEQNSLINEVAPFASEIMYYKY